MIIDVKVPSPGESITEVQLASWLVENGQQVEKDEDIVEIDSDKATLSIAAQATGKIELLIQEGDTVEVGSVIARIDTETKGTVLNHTAKTEPTADLDDDKPKTTEKKIEEVSSEKSNKQNIYKLTISPVARKLMSENNVTDDDLIEFFKSVRFTKKDINYFLDNKDKPLTYETSLISTSLKNESREVTRKKMSMLRKKLAQRLVSVKNETAMLTTFNEVNMSPIMEIRKKYKDKFKEKHEVGLGFMSFFTKAVTEAISFFPQVNSQISGDEFLNFNYVDISIAVSAPKGLVVPVIRNAERMKLVEIEKKIKELALKARENKITLEEMQGGTFTITNGGVFGSMLSTPIINPPQSAILGMHNIVERPIAINGKVEIHPIMFVALSYDHRIIDGRESVGFLVKVKELLEHPDRLLFAGKNPIENLLDL